MTHKMVELEYSLDALEPVISKEIMDLHFSKHYAGYVSALNKAISDNQICEDDDLIQIVKKIGQLPKDSQTAFRNNAGGACNHELYWSILTSDKNSKPEDDLFNDIEKTFGSINNLISVMNDTGMKQFGSGWSWLVWDDGLKVCSTANQDSPLMGKNIAGCQGIPLIGIDVWEHAYYLQYMNKRADYLAAIWDIINWNKVSALYKAAKS